ncbi:MAG: hypothetical protein A2X32_12440 [Elusimicrobia bacterium GWC2_64_44]|nr:MAG: hypothetical protein A2X32_12440 [Elusimicrobia bacterium GWC2_64_44]
MNVAWRGSGAALAAALLLCLSGGPAAAAKLYPSAGTTSAAFLKLGAGARGVAMAGAFSGVPGDPFSIYWNPAGLAYQGADKGLAFFHNEYFQGLGQEFLAYSAPSARGGWGLGLNYFYTAKDLERRSGLNEADPLAPISPSEGKFGAYDVALSAGYGFRAGDGLALGGAVKFIRQSIDDETGAAPALDLGALRSFSWRGGEYTAGLAVLNLGPGIKFVSKSYPLPLTFKAGLSRRLDENGALAALELQKPVDNYPSVALGVEYPLTGRLALRSGYRYRLHGNELGAWSGFSAGAGVAFDRLTFDYAFTPFGVLGNSHRFSINLRFGAAKAAPAARAAPPPAPAGYRSFSFSVSPRPITISPRGVRYEFRAASPDCGISSMTFRVLLRGEAPAEVSLAEGAVSGELLAGFPPGVLPLKTWRAVALPGSVQGDISFVFKVPKQAAGAGRPVFLQRSGSEWLERPAAPAGEDAENYLFSATAPFADDYALGLRVGE